MAGAALAATLGPIAPASAAQPGEIAAASRARVAISVSVANRALVTGVMDAALAPRSGIGAATILQRLCIRSNSATGGFYLVASGNTAQGAFVLSAADGSSVPVALRWTGGSASGEALLPGTPVHDLVVSRTACSDQTSGTLAIEARVARAPAAGLITLTLAPL